MSLIVIILQKIVMYYGFNCNKFYIYYLGYFILISIILIFRILGHYDCLWYIELILQFAKK